MKLPIHSHKFIQTVTQQILLVVEYVKHALPNITRVDMSKKDGIPSLRSINVSGHL